MMDQTRDHKGSFSKAGWMVLVGSASLLLMGPVKF
jgi:hypothetical protein